MYSSACFLPYPKERPNALVSTNPGSTNVGREPSVFLKIESKFLNKDLCGFPCLTQYILPLLSST